MLIIDTQNWLHRASAVMPDLRRRDGQPVGAILGTANMLWSMLLEPRLRSTHIVATFDKGGRRNWRKDLYEPYKANRSTTGDDRRQEIGKQVDEIKRLFSIFGITSLDKAGVEADDLIATVTRMARLEDRDVIVYSTDKDLLQLVAPGVRMWKTTPNRPPVMMDVDAVKDHLGVWPHQVPDYLALVGDTADNIPGVPGIGPVKAARVLQEFDTIEEAFDSGPKWAGAVTRESVVLSKRLATLCPRIMIDQTVDDFLWLKPRFEDVMDYLEEMEFKELMGRVEQRWGDL